MDEQVSRICPRRGLVGAAVLLLVLPWAGLGGR